MFAIRKNVKMTVKPKRPMSAYMLWLNSARESIKSENPGMKVTDIGKKGGEIWKSMKDKTEWEEKAAQAKEQYAKDMSAYMLWLYSARKSIRSENLGTKVTDIGKKRGELWKSMKDKTESEEKAAQAKEQYAKDLESYTEKEPDEYLERVKAEVMECDSNDSNDSDESTDKNFNADKAKESDVAEEKSVKMTVKPKRPMSAYMLWLNSARESIKSENPGMKVTDIGKKGGEIWKSMKDKTEWEEKAAQAKEQYAKDLESYTEKEPHEYLERVKAEAMECDSNDSNDSDESTDENFNADKAKESDVAEDVTRGARTRGARRGRGARVLLPLLVEDEIVPPAGGGRGNRGGRGVRSAVRPKVPDRRPGPSTIDELIIQNIVEMPVGEGLETPLHPKRMRMWQPFVECGQSARSTPSISKSPPTVRPRCSRQILDEDEIASLLNLGSDGSSDDSDDEVVSQFIPRVYRSMLDTPMDDEDSLPNIVPTPATSSPEPSTVASVIDVALAKTHQPNNYYNFNWNVFPNPPIQPELRRETFAEINGPTIPHVDPYDIFVVIWDRQFMEYIASETNRYAQQVAQQMMDKNNLHPNSRIGQWYDTTADELYTYFGIIIAMGVVVKSRLEEYWNTTADIFCTPGFGAHMSINRFILLNKFIHFNNNEDMCVPRLTVSEAKLFKIMPVLSHLNQKFQIIYKCAQNLSLDESLLQWKGLLDINQLVANKAAVMGIKSYEICESQTGYLWRFEIHAHKRTPQRQPEEPLNASTPSIVLRLTNGLENKGHTLWMDNYYNSPSLARRLKASGIDCVGTLRTNRQFVPQALNDLTKGNMHKGQITGLTSGDVDVMVWRDINRVAMISTYHGNAAKLVRESTKPILILDYNIMMGGVDKKDQMLAMYPIERKRTKVWYKKLFRRLLNVSVLNSYIIHHHSSSLTHRNFRITLVKSLLSKHSSIAPLVPRPSAVTTQNRATDVTHRLAEYPLQNSYRKRRVCKVCKKRVHTFCVGCSKSVCLDPCFLTLHS